jgi:cation transport protein ChaC
MSDFWVFGYGSLMWRPGFDFREAAPARLAGAHRALCIYSWVHRGTKQQPGLVLGLDRGGSCRGVAYRVAGENRTAVMAYLRERELVTDVYNEVMRTVTLIDTARSVPAVAYVVNPGHEQYAGRLPQERLLEIVRTSVGKSGTNVDYVIATARHLRSAGVRDHTLDWLADALGSEGEGRSG